MNQQNKALLMSISMLALAIIACTAFQAPAPAPTQDPGPIFTQAAEQIRAEMTLTALVSMLTASPTATVTPETEQPTATNTPTPTAIVVPTNTSQPVPCDLAAFVKDVTIPDDTVLAAGSKFTKTWQIRNIGACAWTTDYDLVFVSGEAMTNKTVIPLPGRVNPNESVNLSVNLTAPNRSGTFRGSWMLRNASGSRFGIGLKVDSAFWVQIKSVPGSLSGVVYDFSANICSADWRSGAGKLACLGPTGPQGYASLSNNPDLENRKEDEITLLTHPNSASSGWISGTYPSITVRDGDHFIARIGCLANSNGCNVRFKLDYLNQNGVLRSLGSWNEVFDGNITTIDVDLSSLAGRSVRFVLTVEVRGGNPERANAFWFVPAIRKVAPTPVNTATFTPTLEPTLTPSLTPTLTPTITETPTPTESPTP